VAEQRPNRANQGHATRPAKAGKANFPSLLFPIDGNTLPATSMDARGKTQYADVRSGMGCRHAPAVEHLVAASEAADMMKRRAHGLSKAELRAAGELAMAQNSKPIVKLPTKLTRQCGRCGEFGSVMVEPGQPVPEFKCKTCDR
jgi:hypothetical protein